MGIISPDERGQILPESCLVFCTYSPKEQKDPIGSLGRRDRMATTPPNRQKCQRQLLVSTVMRPLSVIWMIGKYSIKEEQILYLQILKVTYMSHLLCCFCRFCKAVWETAAIRQNHLQICIESFSGMPWLGRSRREPTITEVCFQNCSTVLKSSK